MHAGNLEYLLDLPQLGEQLLDLRLLLPPDGFVESQLLCHHHFLPLVPGDQRLGLLPHGLDGFPLVLLEPLL